MFDPRNLLDELIAVGVCCDGCDSEGSIAGAKADHAELIELVKAAHSERMADVAVEKLRDTLGEESAEWQLYQAARKRPVAAARSVRYRTETDALMMKALEDAKLADAGDDYQLTVKRADWDSWLAAKDAIRKALPYP